MKECEANLVSVGGASNVCWRCTCDNEVKCTLASNRWNRGNYHYCSVEYHLEQQPDDIMCRCSHNSREVESIRAFSQSGAPILF
jgi:hypothetical protein